MSSSSGKLCDDVVACSPIHADGALCLYSAGVSGLTTALLLAKNKQYAVTVAAKYMPGDYDIEYASPWAGANYLPFVLPFPFVVLKGVGFEQVTLILLLC